jgi:hypothetical protein
MQRALGISGNGPQGCLALFESIGRIYGRIASKGKHELFKSMQAILNPRSQSSPLKLVRNNKTRWTGVYGLLARLYRYAA